jgi:phosphoglycolate phosphatase
LFGSIVGAGDARADKPAPEPVHLALAPSSVPASEEVWLVGDTAIDMECARNAGCIAVLLGDAAPPPEFARFAPHLSFADESGLFRALEGLRFGATRPSS